MRGPLWPCVYLAPLRRYGASKIMGSRPWSFGVMWRHRSCDHSTNGGRLPMGGQLWPCNHREIWRLKDNGVTILTFLGSRDVIGHVTIQLGISVFLLVVHCIHASTSIVKEIWRLKDHSVTILTFWGHVTSSVTWSFDSAYVVSYW